MKKSILGWLAMSLAAGSLQARDISLSTTKAPTGVKIVADRLERKTDPSLKIFAAMDRLIATEVETPRGTFTRLSIPGHQHSGAVGSPALPVMNKIVEVPFGARLEARVVTFDHETVDVEKAGITAPLMPRQPPRVKDGSETPFAYEPGSYNQEGLQQESLVTIEEIGQMRHMRLALVRIAPVAYDPVRGILEVNNNIEIEISMKGADLEKTARIKQRYGSRYIDAVASQVIRPASLASMKSTAARQPTMLIVADRMFESDLEPYIRWKTERGFDVITTYTDALGETTPDTVKAHIHGMYNAPADGHAAPDFVLFVGDNDQIPANQGQSGGWSSHITDLYYVAVTDDYLPEMLTGRFSARTSEELIPQIAKTLEYERFEMADPSFLTDVVMIAGWDSSHAVEWGYPQINYGTQYYFNEEHGIPNAHVFLSAGSDQNETDIHARVSAGASFVNYTAHGSPTSWADPSFTLSDIDALQNEGKYPLAVGNCCVTNQFQTGTCFGEGFVRAAGKGALGYIGGSNNTYWDEDLWWGTGFYPILHPNETGAAPEREQTSDGAYDCAFNGTHATNGGMVLSGNLAVEQSNTSRKLYYWEIYHLMGDPSTMVYFGMPSDNPVQHDAQVNAEDHALSVKAAPGSLIAVSIDGRLHGVGYAGEDGSASIDLSSLPASGTAKVVVTGRNLKPYFGTLAIGQN